MFEERIKGAALAVWNGPLGLAELPEFKEGSVRVAYALFASGARTIVGGGDTISFLLKEGLLDRADYVSTGGGAMLVFLAGEELPGITILKK
jgi:3-phosphoglycerate kinase